MVKAVKVYVNPAQPRETVTLIDMPPSCVIVRRQAKFSWGAQRDHMIVLRTWEDQCLVRERRIAVLLNAH
ncbi:hypothetical protein WJ63_37115 [Burkholderia pyrrocinia]|nr:hypothetical protein WJ63_37115 [Burkholderia pyrrocinia]